MDGVFWGKSLIGELLKILEQRLSPPLQDKLLVQQFPLKRLCWKFWLKKSSLETCWVKSSQLKSPGEGAWGWKADGQKIKKLKVVSPSFREEQRGQPNLKVERSLIRVLINIIIVIIMVIIMIITRIQLLSLHKWLCYDAYQCQCTPCSLWITMLLFIMIGGVLLLW